MTARATLHRWDDVPLDKVTEMVARKAMAGAGWMMVQTYLKKGALVPQHAHEGGQWIYVLQGTLAITVAGETTVVTEGDVLDVPAGAEHQAEALDDSFILDIRLVATSPERVRGQQST